MENQNIHAANLETKLFFEIAPLISAPLKPIVQVPLNEADLSTHINGSESTRENEVGW